MFRTCSRAAFCVVMVILATAAHAFALPGAFTYQGRLEDAGAPAIGLYDVQFRLKSAVTGGFTIGSPVVLEDVSVQDGLFTVTLNANNEFENGAFEAFDGNPRWLEIWVRRGDLTGSHTILSPRQPVTAAPYALTAGALAVPTSAVGDTDADLFVPSGLLSITQNGTAAAILATNTVGGPALAIGSGGVRVVGAGVNTDTAVFIHEVTAANIDCFILCFGTTIDHPLTNGDPNAILIVTPRGRLDRAVPGVMTFFSELENKWRLFVPDAMVDINAPTLETGDRFNILVVKP